MPCVSISYAESANKLRNHRISSTFSYFCVCLFYVLKLGNDLVSNVESSHNVTPWQLCQKFTAWSNGDTINFYYVAFTSIPTANKPAHPVVSSRLAGSSRTFTCQNFPAYSSNLFVLPIRSDHRLPSTRLPGRPHYCAVVNFSGSVSCASRGFYRCSQSRRSGSLWFDIS